MVYKLPCLIFMGIIQLREDYLFFCISNYSECSWQQTIFISVYCCCTYFYSFVTLFLISRLQFFRNFRNITPNNTKTCGPGNEFYKGKDSKIKNSRSAWVQDLSTRTSEHANFAPRSIQFILGKKVIVNSDKMNSKPRKK